MANDTRQIPLMDAARKVALACPACQGLLQRSWNRPTDRVFSKLWRVQRFKCDCQHCRWQGLLRVSNSATGNVANIEARAPKASGFLAWSIVSAAIARWFLPPAARYIVRTSRIAEPHPVPMTCIESPGPRMLAVLDRESRNAGANQTSRRTH